MVEGSHSWLLADPDQFGEVITNDVNVAKAARDLEAASSPSDRRKGIRRVPSLRKRAAADRRSGDRRDDG